MVNMTVIHVRTLMRYIVGIVIVIVITIIFLASIKFGKMEKKEEKESFLNQSVPTFLSCLDDNIPAIHMMNHEEEEASFFHLSKQGLEHKILFDEYGMFQVTKKVSENSEEIKQIAEKESSSIISVGEVTTDLPTEVQPSSVKTTYNTQIGSVPIRNESQYAVTEETIAQEVEYNFKKMMIFHTHTCESYTSTDRFFYTPTGNFRTTDLNFSVARVGDELQKNLEQYGIEVIHDKTYHDYPNYSGSYGRSLKTVQNLLETHSDVNIVFDLHRDAIGDSSYAPKVKIRRRNGSSDYVCYRNRWRWTYSSRLE